MAANTKANGAGVSMATDATDVPPSPLLSVVLTIYNMESCLKPCLDTIAAQTFTDYELICVDDGSTDTSVDILRSYEDAFPCMEIIEQKNKGAAAARNLGMTHARGEFLMLLDSDDAFEPELFETLVARAQKTGADVVVCRSCELDHKTGDTRPSTWTVKTELLPESESFSPYETKGTLLTALMGWPWDKLYRTSYLQEYDLRFPEISNSEDLYFVYLALLNARLISVEEKVLVKHRINRSSSVSNSRLRAPLCFYESAVMLKHAMQKDEKLYREFEWGFLNWAFDYACWNILSLPDGDEKKEVARQFVDGELTELELDRHPLEYYLLYPDAITRFEAIKDYCKPKKEMPRNRSFWGLAARGCASIDREGFVPTLKKVFRR